MDVDLTKIDAGISVDVSREFNQVDLTNAVGRAETAAASSNQSRIDAMDYANQAAVFRDETYGLALTAAQDAIESLNYVIGVDIQAYDPNIVSDGSYVHTDNNFTTLLKTKYDTAYGWGDHALAGYSLNTHNHDAAYSAINHNHNGVYEPADATILKDADIGVTVQGYDADTTKNDAANVFTLPQRTTITAEDNSIDFTASNNFELTATAAPITVGVMATKKGQEGSITIHSAETATGWGTEFLFAPDFSAVTPTPPASPTGTMEFWYKIVEVNGVDGGTANKIHVAWAQ